MKCNYKNRKIKEITNLIQICRIRLSKFYIAVSCDLRTIKGARRPPITYTKEISHEYMHSEI